ncbi:hypothetical protein [Massilia sp. S19_KUP03_FR1]|uniref:hypothetical protein n=1 Tax=Massilia sp. S19_KUP03_FR1 TaxID=3025503 RepID=UPI002FCD9C0E
MIHLGYLALSGDGLMILEASLAAREPPYDHTCPEWRIDADIDRGSESSAIATSSRVCDRYLVYPGAPNRLRKNV